MAGRKVRLRPTDSDLFVAGQIFGHHEYDIGERRRLALNALAGSWRASGEVPVIVDGGANVGYSSLYFAQTFPEAEIIAVEPIAETFELLKENCNGHDRITPVHAALWSHENGVRLDVPEKTGSWAASVGGEGAVPSRTLASLLDSFEGSRLLLLKLDIEGAENEVCLHAKDLLADCPCILIEPHDFMLEGAASLSPLFEAIGGRSFDTVLRGENLMLFSPATLKTA